MNRRTFIESAAAAAAALSMAVSPRANAAPTEIPAKPNNRRHNRIAAAPIRSGILTCYSHADRGVHPAYRRVGLDGVDILQPRCRRFKRCCNRLKRLALVNGLACACLSTLRVRYGMLNAVSAASTTTLKCIDIAYKLGIPAFASARKMGHLNRFRYLMPTRGSSRRCRIHRRRRLYLGDESLK